ncbi:UNVERIFIED_CONTAM: hypothetical protein Cloal_1782 [Acetivibrio alkalicellulosi]
MKKIYVIIPIFLICIIFVTILTNKFILNPITKEQPKDTLAEQIDSINLYENTINNEDISNKLEKKYSQITTLEHKNLDIGFSIIYPVSWELTDEIHASRGAIGSFFRGKIKEGLTLEQSYLKYPERHINGKFSCTYNHEKMYEEKILYWKEVLDDYTLINITTKEGLDGLIIKGKRKMQSDYFIEFYYIVTYNENLFEMEIRMMTEESYTKYKDLLIAVSKGVKLINIED